MWWNDVIDKFLCPTDFIDRALHVLDTIIGIITLIIAIKGVEIAVSAFSKFKEKRNGAIWDFYMDLSTFLHRLRLTIGSLDNPSNVSKYLYEGTMPTSEKDKREVEMFLGLAKNFLEFLSTGDGQIPTTDNFDEWNSHRVELVDFLNTVLYIGVRIDIVDPNARADTKEEKLKEKINSVITTITYMETGIKNIIVELKKEIDKSKKKKRILFKKKDTTISSK